MADPRAENCRAYHLDAGGRVDGVKLEYLEVPSSLYRLVLVQLIGEAEAAGNTVATCTVLDLHGVTVAERVYLAWPWPSIANRALPGNPSGQHMISNGYDAAKGALGPLGLYVGNAAGNPISDLVGGLGLPNNRHVCFRATWQERSTEPEPGSGVDLAPVLSKLDAIHADLAKFMKHLGAI